MPIKTRYGADQLARVQARCALFTNRHAAITFGQAVSVIRDKQWNVCKRGRNSAEQTCKKHLTSRRTGQVGASYDVGDAHSKVVDNDSELIRINAIAASQYEIASHLGDIFGATTTHEVVCRDDRTRVVRYGKTNRWRAFESTRMHSESSTSSRISWAFVTCVRSAGDAGNLCSGAIAQVGVTFASELINRGFVQSMPFRLHVRSAFTADARSFLKTNAKPREVFHDALGRSLNDARRVDVFHAQDERSVRLHHACSTKYGRRSAAKMQIASG